MSDFIRMTTVTDQVLDYLRAAPAGDWHTLAAIAAATALTVSQVNGVIYDLLGLGVVEKQRPARPGHGEQCYRWRA
jgi:DNA-binding IclR family transcriptional regulator